MILLRFFYSLSIHEAAYFLIAASSAHPVKFILLTQVDGKKPRHLHINRFWNNELAKQTEYLKPSFNHSATSLEGKMQNSLMFFFILTRVARNSFTVFWLNNAWHLHII